MNGHAYIQTPDGTLESEFSLPLFPYQSLPNKKRPRAGELIELASFGFVEIENIERQGAGHEFQPTNLDHPAWCDRCGDLIWCVGPLGQLVQCTQCKFTCHANCLQFITVDCQPQPPVAPLIEHVDRAPSPNLSISNLSREELMHLINKHNRQVVFLRWLRSLIETFRISLIPSTISCKPQWDFQHRLYKME